MQIGEVTRLLVGSALIYVVVAICVGCPSHDRTTQDAGGSFGSIQDAVLNPVPGASAQTTNGTRLKAEYWTADDGTRAYLPNTFWDSERGEECQFRLASDGVLRCLPLIGAAVDSPTNAYYSDSGCTTRLGAVDCSGNQPKYSGQTDSLCSSLAHVYTNQSVYTGPVYHSSTYYDGAPYGTPECTLMTWPTTENRTTVYNLGPEIPASSFVAATVQHD
jgi:hypothetical protein